ncbi:hypothetical protein [Rhizobium sp. FY34]|uniref:hypothetical protein n=1 Tax=Rhizobium sp. FY34 TaxID=2562309 RepID=UPI0010C03794|nr:hypothetical protein [Rhizobium sp. FY34]
MGEFFGKAGRRDGWAKQCPSVAMPSLPFDEGAVVLPKTLPIVAKYGDHDRLRKRHVSPAYQTGVNDRVFGVRFMTLLQSGSGTIQAAMAGETISRIRFPSIIGMVKEV